MIDEYELDDNYPLAWEEALGVENKRKRERNFKCRIF